MNTFTRAALTVLVGLVIWFLPHTEAIKPEGWHLLAIFTATIVGFILRPWPTGIMALFGIVAAVATKSITMVQALGGYAEANVWLIVAAVFFSRGIINSGLGKRIAYTLICSFGTSSLKLAYALACTDLIISPATPSNTARGGGIEVEIHGDQEIARTDGRGSRAGYPVVERPRPEIGSRLLVRQFLGQRLVLPGTADRKVAPLGDPVEVTVRGYELSLRKADAEMIEVE